MKNLSLASAKQNAKFLFFTNEVIGAEVQNNQIKQGKEITDVLVWSQTEQNLLGTELGKEMAKRNISTREVQSGDTIGAITKGFKESKKLNITSIFKAKVRYEEGTRPSQEQIDKWNKNSKYKIPQDIATKMINGEEFAMQYANFLSPGQYVWTEGTETVVVGKNKPQEKTNGAWNNPEPGKDPKKENANPAWENKEPAKDPKKENANPAWENKEPAKDPKKENANPAWENKEPAKDPKKENANPAWENKEPAKDPKKENANPAWENKEPAKDPKKENANPAWDNKEPAKDPKKENVNKASGSDSLEGQGVIPTSTTLGGAETKDTETQKKVASPDQKKPTDVPNIKPTAAPKADTKKADDSDSLEGQGVIPTSTTLGGAETKDTETQKKVASPDQKKPTDVPNIKPTAAPKADTKKADDSDSLEGQGVIPTSTTLGGAETKDTETQKKVASPDQKKPTDVPNIKPTAAPKADTKKADDSDSLEGQGVIPTSTALDGITETTKIDRTNVVKPKIAAPAEFTQNKPSGHKDEDRGETNYEFKGSEDELEAQGVIPSSTDINGTEKKDTKTYSSDVPDLGFLPKLTQEDVDKMLKPKSRWQKFWSQFKKKSPVMEALKNQTPVVEQKDPTLVASNNLENQGAIPTATTRINPNELPMEDSLEGQGVMPNSTEYFPK